jgi:hypothetical protein
MTALPKIAHARRRRPLVVWCLAIGTTAAVVWIGIQGFAAVRWAVIDLQAFSRWEHQTVEADKATIDNTILPAIEVFARREGRLPADLQQLVTAGDLASVPVSQAGVWSYKMRQDAFEIGVGDPPHGYPSAYRVVELDGTGNADPDRWRVRDWYHDS